MKAPHARLFQVWIESAKGDGSYWLDRASPSLDAAELRYGILRAGYYKAELRTPLGAVLFSWDKTRVNTTVEDVRFMYAE